MDFQQLHAGLGKDRTDISQRDREFRSPPLQPEGISIYSLVFSLEGTRTEEEEGEEEDNKDFSLIPHALGRLCRVLVWYLHNLPPSPPIAASVLPFSRVGLPVAVKTHVPSTVSAA